MSYLRKQVSRRKILYEENPGNKMLLENNLKNNIPLLRSSFFTLFFYKHAAPNGAKE
jgi:hypothetical protein